MRGGRVWRRLAAMADPGVCCCFPGLLNAELLSRGAAVQPGRLGCSVGPFPQGGFGRSAKIIRQVGTLVRS